MTLTLMRQRTGKIIYDGISNQVLIYLVNIIMLLWTLRIYFGGDYVRSNWHI